MYHTYSSYAAKQDNLFTVDFEFRMLKTIKYLVTCSQEKQSLTKCFSQAKRDESCTVDGGKAQADAQALYDVRLQQ